MVIMMEHRPQVDSIAVAGSWVFWFVRVNISSRKTMIDSVMKKLNSNSSMDFILGFIQLHPEAASYSGIAFMM